jgi:pilus assembly protein CpaE
MHAIFTCEKPADRDSYRQILINSGLECGAEDAVVYEAFIQRFNRGGADLVIVAMGSDPQMGLAVVQEVHARGTLPILVVGPSHDAQLILQSLKAGAREYLDIDQLRDGLHKALEKLGASKAIQFRRGRTIAVTGANPGIGVTTVASGLAFALAKQYPKDVLLSELSPGIPELALDLDLRPTITVTQLLRDWNRVDASTIRKAVFEHPGGVHILADNATFDAPPSFDAGAGKQLISLVRTLYEYAVYDLGHGTQTSLVQEAVRQADRVIVVVRLDVPSLRLTHAYLSHLADLGIPQHKLMVVANKYGQSQQVSWKKVEEAIGVKVDLWLPDDPATVNYALNLGLSLPQASSWAKIIRRFGELAHQLNGKAK